MPNFADNETPAGTIDGTNAAFALAHAPSPAASLQLFFQYDTNVREQVTRLYREGVDYTLSGSTITFATAPPDSISSLVAFYRY